MASVEAVLSLSKVSITALPDEAIFSALVLAKSYDLSNLPKPETAIEIESESDLMIALEESNTPNLSGKVDSNCPAIVTPAEKVSRPLDKSVLPKFFAKLAPVSRAKGAATIPKVPTVPNFL